MRKWERKNVTEATVLVAGPARRQKQQLSAADGDGMRPDHGLQGP